MEWLFSQEEDGSSEQWSITALIRPLVMDEVLQDLTARTKEYVRIFRLADAGTTQPFAQTAWRRQLDDRIRRRTLAVERVEVFYSLERLKEVLSNILRYDGCHYRVRTYCTGMSDIVPALNGYIFDGEEFVLSARQSDLPSANGSSLRLAGPPFKAFFREYWANLRERGTLLCAGNANDLSALRTVAQLMGLPARLWQSFVADARALSLADGTPPLP